MLTFRMVKNNITAWVGAFNFIYRMLAMNSLNSVVERKNVLDNDCNKISSVFIQISKSYKTNIKLLTLRISLQPVLLSFRETGFKDRVNLISLF